MKQYLACVFMSFFQGKLILKQRKYTCVHKTKCNQSRQTFRLYISNFNFFRQPLDLHDASVANSALFEVVLGVEACRVKNTEHTSAMKTRNDYSNFLFTAARAQRSSWFVVSVRPQESPQPAQTFESFFEDSKGA